MNKKISLISAAFLVVIGCAATYQYSRKPVMELTDNFFESKYQEVESKLNTKLDYDNFIKGWNVLSHEIKNGEKLVRWKDGDKIALYVTDMDNNLLMIVYTTYLNSMENCVNAYQTNLAQAQNIYKATAVKGPLDYSSQLTTSNKEILFYCSGVDKEYVNLTSYQYIKN